MYPVDVAVEAADRQGLLRDISEVFAREKMNVIGVQTQSVKGTAWMTFTVEIADVDAAASRCSRRGRAQWPVCVLRDAAEEVASQPATIAASRTQSLGA